MAMRKVDHVETAVEASASLLDRPLLVVMIVSSVLIIALFVLAYAGILHY